MWENGWNSLVALHAYIVGSGALTDGVALRALRPHFKSKNRIAQVDFVARLQ